MEYPSKLARGSTLRSTVERSVTLNTEQVGAVAGEWELIW